MSERRQQRTGRTGLHSTGWQSITGHLTATQAASGAWQGSRYSKMLRKPLHLAPMATGTSEGHRLWELRNTGFSKLQHHLSIRVLKQPCTLAAELQSSQSSR